MNLDHLNHNGNSNAPGALHGQPHMNLDELFTLLRNEIPEGRQALLDTQSNLEKVADYCTTAYNESKDKRAAFEKTQNYTTHSLASVAYQINTLAYNILHMLELQANQIAEMESQTNYVSQKMAFHEEKVARREIALLTSAKSIPRQPKVLIPANEEKQGKYVRKAIDYSILDDIGHGVRVESSNQIYRAPSNSSTRMSGIQTLGPKSSMSSLSHYHHFNTLTGSGPAPTTKPPTPPQAVRSMGTLGRNQNKEYRTLAPPIAPPQVPKNYESNYPLGHPKNPLTQRQSSATYSTLPNNGHPQYSHYGGTMSAAALNANPVSQYGQSMMAHPMVHASNGAPPPPPPIARGMSSASIGSESLPEPPPHMTAHHGHHNASFDSTRSAGSPPLPPPPPIAEQASMGHTGVHQHPASAIYGSSLRQVNLPDWVPPNYIEKVIAIYDYNADKDDELTFQENSVIYVIRKNDDGWYEGVMNGVTGLFPGNYVEPCV